jgi:hypothetical protein
MLTRTTLVPEPPTKRKTLVERAGEPPATTLKSQIPGKAGNVAAFGLRQPGSLLTHRAQSNTPAISYQNGNRPASRQANVSRAMAPPRPPSSAEVLGNGYDQESDQESSMSGSRKGTYSSISYPGISIRKTRSTPVLRRQEKIQTTNRTATRSQHSGSDSNTDDGGMSSKLS